eukprot:TRINITY_DN13968_c0_g2_i1.p1 TRINITY_DN13968_c0_g2~~TRINITY_DN13968_c0_g2_i1.p1  ORF type:complete len:158 (+),score=35.67 TRINITY_DN13968_c0_g2_i1:142-615(+)
MPVAMSGCGDVKDGWRAPNTFMNWNINQSDIGNIEVVAGWVECGVVGMKYYKGGVQTGDIVCVERELNNAHDPNAIKVINRTRSNQVGHIPRNVASLLSPLLDRGFLTLTAHIVAPPTPTSLQLLLTLTTIHHHLANGIQPTLQGCPGFKPAQHPIF